MNIETIIFVVLVTAVSSQTCGQEFWSSTGQEPCTHCKVCDHTIGETIISQCTTTSDAVCDINQCIGNNQCGDHGTCSDGINFWICACDHGYESYNPTPEQGNATNKQACRIMECTGVDAAVTNGSLGDCTATLIHDESCTPECDSGYTPSGERSCSEDELTNTFTCSPDPCDASAVPTNGTAGNCDAALASGSSCEPTCSDGYTESGGRTCTAGTLTTDNFECLANSCDASAVPENGTAGNCNAALASGTSCAPTCSSGYTESGTRTCTAGTLTTDDFACSANPCEPASVANSDKSSEGSITGVFDGEDVVVTCDSGYNGSGNAHCESTGTFTLPTCTADSCDASAVPENGTAGNCDAALASGSSCAPTCSTGYTESGTRTCTAGTLTTNDFACSANPCEPASVANSDKSTEGSITGVFDGADVVVECDLGYIISGADAHCESTGTFTLPTCTALPCPGAPNGDGYGSECDSLVTDDNCTQTCTVGYNDNNDGNGQIYTCPSGVLAGNLIECTPAPCTDTIPTDTGYGEECSGLVTNDTCIQTCMSGYIDNNSGNGQEYTCIDGVFDGILLECTEVSCADTVVDNSYTFLTGDVETNPIAVVCIEGYVIYGEGSAVCQHDGTWSILSCDVKPDPCDASVVPTNGTDAGDCTDNLESGSTCTPTCNNGFTVSGTSSCTEGNLTAATCEYSSCDATTITPENGSVGNCTTTLAHGSTCTPVCDDGYHLAEGSPTSCSAGQLTVGTCDQDPAPLVTSVTGLSCLYGLVFSLLVL